MTISPLMVELFFPNWYDGPATAANWPPGHFYWEDVWGAFPRAMSACGVDHQSKRRDMKIKSTFNISFQIRFVCFVLKIFIVSWILLVVAFNLLTPWCSFLQKGRLMKLCDGDCTIKKKRNRQWCLILKHFPGSKCQDRAYLKPTEGICCLCALLVSIRKAKCSLQFLSHYPASPYTETYNCEYTLCLYDQRKRGDTRD